MDTGPYTSAPYWDARRNLTGQGGNIVQAVNSPSDQFHVKVDGLVKELEEGEL